MIAKTAMSAPVHAAESAVKCRVMLPEADVIEQFRMRRNRQLIISIPAVIVIGLLVWFADHPQSSPFNAGAVLPIVGIVFVVGLLILSFVNWRCPACDAYLGRGINPRFCRKCGARLQF